jgi:hypothetical protein
LYQVGDLFELNVKLRCQKGNRDRGFTLSKTWSAISSILINEKKDPKEKGEFVY